MKQKKHLSKGLMIFAFIALIVTVMTVLLTTTISASDAIETVGEMEEDFDGGEGIASAFESYKIQDTVRMNDSFINGDIQYTLYFDRGEGNSNTVIPNYNGTRIILYTVNTAVERIGTDTNREIISSMLDRGYLVIVVDYLGDPNATWSEVSNSISSLTVDVRNGKLFDKTTEIGAELFAESGSYRENFVVPSGYNVLLEEVFWEIDKHGMEGTLDKIVEVWNSDFIATKAEYIVKWVRVDGSRKTTQSVDGEAAIWYSDAAGTVEDAENGQYTKVKYTVAETITDCVDPDGTPLDMNLYAHVVYPTSPENKVPVMVKTNSSGDLSKTLTNSAQPGVARLLYSGYAVAAYDYLWVPMALDISYGYYDGSQGVTKDHMNYGLMMYNDKLINTAAMRFLRHLSANGGDIYNFDLDSFGVFGISKGGWFKFLGEKIVQSPLVMGTYSSTAEREEAINAALSALIPDRYFSNQKGETRYQVGAGAIDNDVYTGDYVIEAGERQPWLTYPDGSEIISGCQATYAAAGGQNDDVTEGHVPMFDISGFNDPWGSGRRVSSLAVAKALDIPYYHFDTNLGHEFAYGYDLNYGIELRDATLDFWNYYIKGDPVKILYVTPRTDAPNVPVTSKITVKFMGTVTAEEIEKVVVASASGAVSGVWESAFGGTEWTFTPDYLAGRTVYTVNIPEDIKGDNGLPMGSAYSSSFVTEYDGASELISSSGYYTFTAPALTGGNSFAFRFFVANDAVNTAELYAVENEGDTDGTLLGKINVKGSGSYEIDVTDHVIENAGREITLLLKTGRGTTSETIVDESLSGEKPSNLSLGTKINLTQSVEIGGRVAAELYVKAPTKYGVSQYYSAEMKAFTYKNVFGGYSPTLDDVGRTYTVKFDVYDTISRTLTLSLQSVASNDAGVSDKDWTFINFNTKAGEWTTFEFTYTVYEPTLGSISVGVVQALDVKMETDGNNKSPLYLSNFKVVEELTEMTVANAYIAEKDNGLGGYTAPVSDKAFAIYNGDTLVGEYEGLAGAIAAYTSGYTVRLQRDYHLTDADLTDAVSDFASVNLDLGEYTVYCDNTSYSLFHIKADNAASCEINVSGGNILIGKTALISYEGSTSGGNGKNVNIDFQNTYIGFNDTAYTTEIISSGTGVSNVNISSDISLTDCVIDLPDESHAKSESVIFPESETEELKLTYSVSRGEIRLSSVRWIKVVENMLDLEFVADADGDMTKIIMPSYISYEIEGTFRTSVGYANFVSGDASGGYVAHTLVVPVNSTKYGIIPESYMDADKYPFVVFDEKGNFLGAYANFMGANTNTSAIGKTKNTQAENTYDEALGIHVGTNCVILMRRDYTYIDGERYDNWAQIAGEFTLDLGGHSMSQSTEDSARRSLFTITSKAWTNNRKFPHYFWPTTMNIINGSLYTYDMPFFNLQAWESVNADNRISDKLFTLNFDNVTFGLIDGASVSEMMIKCRNIAGGTFYEDHPAPFCFNFDGCTFDLTNKSTAETFALLDADSESGKWMKFTFDVAGGKIIADDLTGVDLNSSNGVYGSSIKFTRDENGEYITLEAPASLGDISEAFPTDEGTKYFVKKSETDGTAVYYLERSTIITKYGAIPSSEIDTEAEKPFAVFVKDTSSETGYVYSGVHAAWKDAAAAAVGASGSVVYLRADALLSESVATATFTGSFGKVTVDLNGNTLTRVNGNLVDAAFENTAKQTSEIAFENGSIVNSSECTSSNGMFVINYTSANSALATFNITFDNVSFINEKTTNMLFTLWENGYSTSGTVGSKSTVTFNNCTLDSNGATAFMLYSTSNTSYNKTDINVVINGGIIISDTAVKTAGLYKKNSDDTVKFGKYNGEYTKITLPTSVSYPAYSIIFEGTGGERLSYVATETAGAYVLGEDLKTDYGYIPARYASITSYPFVVFDENKNLLGVHANLLDITSSYDNAGALHIAKNYLAKNNYWDGEGYGDSPAAAYIVMRRDYTMNSEERYNNIAQIQGLLTIDLGGHTLTASQERTLFPAVSKGWSSGDADNFHSTQFKFIHGSIVAYNKPIVNYSCSCAELKTFDIAFEDIDFKACGTAQSFIMDYASSGKTSYPNISFEDCTFDITESKADSVILFNLGKSLMQASFTVSGGSVVAGDTALTLFLKPDDVNGTLTFSKGDNGKYLEIRTNSGAAPAGTFNDGALEFVKVAEDTYTLATAGLNAFTPKMSITLGSELVYNIYVPAIDILKSYTVDGVAAEDAELVTVDDVEYYLIKVSLPAKEAARNIVLKATVTLNDKDCTGTWTVSIPKYAEKILADGSDVEKTLVKDVLQYIRAAYAYFGTTDAEQLAKIDTLLGEYASKPTVEGSAEDETTGLGSATFVLDGTPSMRFYLANRADASKYKFFIDEKQVATEVADDGSYVDIDVYAYALCETVTYTVDGETGGSFHINAYYSYVSGENYTADDKAELVALTECFWRYLQSARDYRNFVVNG